MIIKTQSEDGQDFIVRCGEQTGGVGLSVWNYEKPKADIEPFTIEEVKAIVASLEFAIKIAEEEREEMEKRNGY